MKKLVFVLVVFAAAAAVFFPGWVQLKVPPGSVGIIRSKTHGVDSRPLVEGEFRWVWYACIPANAAVQSYKLPALNIPVRASGDLPSAAVYAAFAGLKADFSFEIDGTVFCSLKAQALPALIQRLHIEKEDDLSIWERRWTDDIGNFIRQKLWHLAENEAALEEARLKGAVSSLAAELSGAFPDFENWNQSFRTLRFPDFTLYRNLKELYTEYGEAQKKLMGAEIPGAAARLFDTRRRIDELSLYGELLSKHPHLLDYLALEKGIAIPRGEK